MIDEIKRQSLEVRVFKNRHLLGEDAAETVGRKMIQLLASQESVNMVFAAAPSQNEFLHLLSQRKDIDWSRVNAFHMDEYLDLPADAPQGFGNFLKARIFSKVPFHKVNYINGNPNETEEECDRYSALLQKYPPDIVCMGIGENGHIAFNDPPVADFNDRRMVKMVELDEFCRQQQVNDGCFDTLSQVPARALTVTIPPLMSASFVYCIVPGKSKANAVYNTLNKEVSEKYPSSILRTHQNAILFLDTQSSQLLEEVLH